MRPVEETAIPATTLKDRADPGRWRNSTCWPLIVEEMNRFEGRAVDSRVLRDLLSVCKQSIQAQEKQ